MRAALAALVVLATLPYLTLKALWLTGHPLGVLDPAFLASPGLPAANLATAGLDLVAVVLAVLLASRLRPPAWTVLLPGWVGSGFLAPVVLTTVPGLLLEGPAGPEPLATWVKPLVYGGFTLQGVGLMGLLALHTTRRWPDALRPGAPVGWARTVVALATLPVALVAGLELAEALGSTAGLPAGATWSAASALVGVVKAALALGAVLGGLLVVRGRRTRVTVAVGVVGSATLFSWGLYGTAITVGGTVFAASTPLDGLASLTSLLTGLVVGTALLGTLAQPAPAGASTTSASKQVRSPV